MNSLSTIASRRETLSREVKHPGWTAARTDALLCFRMALNALEHRNITQIHGMLERPIRFVAILAFVIGERAQINRMLEGTGLHVLLRRRCRVVDHRVADVTVVGNDFARVADVLAVMTAEAAREIEMANVVWVSLPVGLHLRKKVCLEDALNFGDRAFDRNLLLRVDVFVIRAIKLIQARIN